ncbi:MAG: hypothetical protein JOY61_07050 [Chloroflexi bacterium]|nr:hypothetical protein [Chloroflexota bacterium]
MRDRIEPADPGDDEVRSITWRDDDPIRPGARVEATDGVLGTVRERRRGQGPEQAYLGVDTDEGLVFVPERLIRETRGDTVYLSLPRADARAQGSPDKLPVRDAPDQLPHPPR